ncbi:MAG: FecR domain-containing protein [Pseudomonadota bacterium]
MSRIDKAAIERSRAAHEWRSRIWDEDASPAQRLEHQAWLRESALNEEAYDRAVTYWNAYGELARSDIDADLLPRELSAESSRAGRGQESTKPYSRLMTHFATDRAGERWAVAAALAGLTVLAASLLVLLLPQASPPAAVGTYTRYTTATGETRSLELADGSTVSLGADSVLDTTLGERERRLELHRGSALFDVYPDGARPFVVTASGIQATALGTRFDVRNNGGVVRVAVAEGRVEVSMGEDQDRDSATPGKAKRLVEGQTVAATRADGLGDVKPFSTENVGAWERHRLIYDDATIAELVADLSRYHPQRLILEGAPASSDDARLTAAFDARELERALNMLELSFPVQIERAEPQTIRLRWEENK